MTFGRKKNGTLTGVGERGAHKSLEILMLS